MTMRNPGKKIGRLRRPSTATLIAILALVLATVGTGIAASKFSGKQIKKRSEPGNRLKKNTITGTEVKESKLGQVPKAGDAQTLAGHPASDFFSSGKLKRFAVRLNFGQTQQLFTAGPLTFTAKCVQNQTDPDGNANADFAEILIATSQNGSVFDGSDAKRGDTPTTFLNTDTPEDERQFFLAGTAPTGTGIYQAELNSDGAARAPDGTTVAFNASGVGGSVNELGTACTVHGFAMIVAG